MKKTLSLVMALMMLISMICAIPVMADEPDGSQANPYYVANPMTAPNFITIPANSTVYYQYNALVFNGWSVEGYGLSAITVDGMVYDTLGMWGSIYVEFSFNMMSPGVVGYVNDTAEEIEVMLTHTEPMGSLDNPAELENGENAFSIPASIMEYVAIYVPYVNGDVTFSTEQVEDFQIIVFADASPAEGGTPIFVENGSLTLTLESYMPVYVVISPMGITGDVILTVTPPKAGTESNPIWLDDYSMDEPYAVEADTDLYFQIDGSLSGNTLNMESVAGADFTAVIGGVEYASEGGILTLVLDSGDWYVDMVLSSAVDNEIAFSIEYAAGTMWNPIAIELGDTEISIPAGVDSGYFYTYVVEKDGLLIATPSDKSGIGYMDLADESYEHYSYLTSDSANSAMMIPVTAGEVITINSSGLYDEELYQVAPVSFTLNLAWKDLVVFNNFNNYDEEGNNDPEGWASSSVLSVTEEDYFSNWGSLKFEATNDWANIYKYLNLEANTDYEISFKAKGALDKGLWIKFNKDWAADVAQADVNLTSEWTDYTVTLNSGDNTSLVMLFQYNGVAADGQIIWLDDIVITKVASDEPAVPPVEPQEPIFSSLLVQFIGRLPSNDPKNGLFVSLSNDGQNWSEPVVYAGHGMDMWGCANTVDPTYLGTIDITEQAKSLTSDQFFVKIGMGAGDITWVVLHQVRIVGIYTGETAETEFFWDDYSNLPAFGRNGSNASEAVADLKANIPHIVDANLAFLQGCGVDHQATGISPYHGGYYGEPENVNGYVVYAINQELPEPPAEEGDKVYFEFFGRMPGDVNNANKVQVMVSSDGVNWTEAALLEGPRDDHSDSTYFKVDITRAVDLTADNLYVKMNLISYLAEWCSARQIRVTHMVDGVENVLMHVIYDDMAIGSEEYKSGLYVDSANMQLRGTYDPSANDPSGLTMNEDCDGQDGKVLGDNYITYKIVLNEPDVLMGDVDGDGKINNRDLGILQRYLNAYAVSIDELAADLDGNGKINNRDLGLLQKMLNS